MRLIMHLDMNSYFASVEQQANPFLRGKSVGVCAYLSERGCIIASSKEAKAKGIRTGCRVSDAKLLDPRAIFIENEPAKYRAVTARIFAILSEYSDKMEPYSIDEAFVDLSDTARDYAHAAELAAEIQQRILDEVGEWLKCSIGISWTRFLAKYAGDTAPKGGILCIRPDNLEACLEKPVTEAWGIAKAMQRRLSFLGIFTLNDLRRADGIRLKKVLGSYGYYMWANVNGHEIAHITTGAAAPKSIGHSYCLAKRSMDREYIEKVLYKLCEKTGRRLRERDLEARRCCVYVSFHDGEGMQQTETNSEGLFTTDEVFAAAQRCFSRIPLNSTVRMLAISSSRLAPVSGQMTLFASDTFKKRDLGKALDKINDKYGEYTVVKGIMNDMSAVARDRVGFRKTILFTKA